MTTIPHCFLDDTFCVRSYESGIAGYVSLSALCDYFQEIAGENVNKLGIGIRELQTEGFTWMLARIHIVVSRYAKWGEKIHLRTWPSGFRGRLLALRDFEAEDDAGQPLVKATSEWLYIDMRALKMARVPESFLALTPPGTPHLELPPSVQHIPDFEKPAWSKPITVRRCDLDFNNHVNNAHYVDWALEGFPAGRQPDAFEIVFKQSAVQGDTILSEAAPADAHTTLHRILRASNRAVLAVARSVWEKEV